MSTLAALTRVRKAWPRSPWLPAAAAFLLLTFAAACGGGDDKDASSGAAPAPTSASSSGGGPAPTAAPARTATTAASNPTRAPSPVTMSAAAVADLEARIDRAYRDNRTFMPRATIDDLKVTFSPATGLVSLAVRPLPTSANTIGGNSQFVGGAANDTLAITSQSSVAAGKAIWSSFPEVKRVNLAVSTEFTLTSGSKVTEVAAEITVDRATGEKMDYTALQTSVKNEPRSFFCAADAYKFHVAVWPTITDKGCLTGPSKGVTR